MDTYICMDNVWKHFNTMPKAYKEIKMVMCRKNEDRERIKREKKRRRKKGRGRRNMEGRANNSSISVWSGVSAVSSLSAFLRGILKESKSTS